MTPSPSSAGSVAQQDDTRAEPLNVKQGKAGIEFLREDHVPVVPTPASMDLPRPGDLIS
jgi:hypothetical protein